MESHPDMTKRYDYVIRTLEKGTLLDEPIPQMEFVGERDPSTRDGWKMLADMVKVAEYSSGYTRALELIVNWLAFALAIGEKEPSIGDKHQEQLYRLCDLSKWMLAPTDYLGEYMAEIGSGKAGGFFPTPMSICTLMAQLNYDHGRDHRLTTAMDPAVGTGRTLLVTSNYSLRLYGQDINYLCVLICKINFALYAPWFHIPEHFFPEEATTTQLLPENASHGAGIGPNGPIQQPTKTAEKRFSTKIEQPTLF